MSDTILTCDLEACLLNIIFTDHDKQKYIFENTDRTFFTDNEMMAIYETAKRIFKNKGVVTNVDVYEKNPDFNTPLYRIITEPAAYITLTEYYCKKLYERRLNELISEAKTEEEIENIKEFKQKYSNFDLKVKHISDGTDGFDERYKNKRKTSITTGYSALDDKIGSFMGGDYIALGGSTGMGKTSIALNIANMLCLQDKKVLYFSLEMPLEQLQNRFVCMVMGLDARKFRNFGFTPKEMEKYKNGLNGLKEWNLNVVCDYNLTTDKLKMYSENQKKKGLDFVIIDYLGLMSGYENKSMYEKMTNLSRQIKLIATELEVPILVLVQLNRDLKNRENKRPMLSDIRESGAIEQDADFVMFAYRDGLYNPEASDRDLEIIIAKNRHGTSSCIAKLNFDLNTQTITEKEFDYVRRTPECWGNQH